MRQIPPQTLFSALVRYYDQVLATLVRNLKKPRHAARRAVSHRRLGELRSRYDELFEAARPIAEAMAREERPCVDDLVALAETVEAHAD